MLCSSVTAQFSAVSHDLSTYLMALICCLQTLNVVGPLHDFTSEQLAGLLTKRANLLYSFDCMQALADLLNALRVSKRQCA